MHIILIFSKYIKIHYISKNIENKYIYICIRVVPKE